MGIKRRSAMLNEKDALIERTPVKTQQNRCDFTLIAKGSPPSPRTDLAVGGLPSHRVFLRFNIPTHIVDSSSVLRATLLLTQRPNPLARVTDTLVVFPQVVVASDAVSDVSKAAGILAAPGLGIDSVLIAPHDSGARTIDIVFAIRQWRAQVAATTRTQRSIVLRSKTEGWSALAASFFSSEAPLALRPRLRVSYVARLNFGRP